MEIAVKSLFFSLNPNPKKLSVFTDNIIMYRQDVDVVVPKLHCRRLSVSPQKGQNVLCVGRWGSQKHCSAVSAELSGLQDVELSSSSPSENFTVSTSGVDEAGVLKISVEACGAKTRAIFNEVFDKMVAAAQPIPGFRRVKGGKTPNIPRDVLLEILGPSVVYKQVIKKVINSVVAEYVEKENLKVTTDLRVEQSYEDLEDVFEPDENFSFGAVIHLQETK